MTFNQYKIEIFIPEEALNNMLEALAGAHAGEIGNYDHCFSVTPITGYWRPNAQANPFLGETGKLSSEKELKVEVNCREEYLREAVQAIRKAHPYEEPVINIIALHNQEYGGTM
jgi:hypothetical protein